MTQGGCDIIAVGNLKGGCGKTTIAVNLACCMAEVGRSVVLLDADPQQSAAVWARRGALPMRVRSAPLRALDKVGAWTRAVEYLRYHHDLIVIDLPAVAAPALGAALLMARLAIVPTSGSPLDLHGAMRMRRFLDSARRERGSGAPAALIAPMRMAPPMRAAPSGPSHASEIERRMKRIGEPIGPPIQQRVHHAEAFIRGDWVGAMAPGSAAHREVLRFAQRALEHLERAPRPEPLAQFRAELTLDPPRRGAIRPAAAIEPEALGEAAAGGLSGLLARWGLSGRAQRA